MLQVSESNISCKSLIFSFVPVNFVVLLCIFFTNICLIILGFVLGAGTALLGEKAAMACTVAVETVIVEHYNDQLRTLMQDPNVDKELLDTIKHFRDDEQEHHDTGLDHGAKQAPMYEALTEFIKFGCKTAIAISKVI